MKSRVVYLILAICLMFSLTACNTQPDAETQQSDDVSSPVVSANFYEEEFHPEDLEIVYENYILYEKSNGEIGFSFMVEAKNIGQSNLELANGKFLIKDTDGNVLGMRMTVLVTDCVPNIIAPGESWYFFVSGAEPYGGSGVTDVNGDYVFETVLNPWRVDYDDVRYTISNVHTESTYVSNDTYAGVVTNDADKPNEFAAIDIVFFREDGTPYVMTSAYVNDLEPGTSRDFSAVILPQSYFLEFDFSLDEIASYEIFACARQR